MKLNLSRYVRALRAGLADVVRLHPVELALILVAGLGLVVLHELSDNEWDRFGPRLLTALWYALPLFAFGLLAGRGPWRRIYYVAWAPLVPLVVWSGLPEWLESVQFGLTAMVLTPLAVLLCRAAADNRRFVSDAMVYLRAAVLAGLFSNVALGLFQAILWSAAYIFGFSGAKWVGHLSVDSLILAETVGVPLLFLMMYDRWAGGACRAARAAEVLITYIVTPALVAYAALLYLYAAKILFTWSLPRGGVAWMVFVFGLMTLAVKALRETLDKRTAEWFYGRFSLVMLPATVLFWAGVARRVGEYGLTTMRIYLLVCGAVMTLAVVLFFARRTGRYLYVGAAAFVLFAALAYVPQLDPERAALDSQLRRAQRIARSLDRLDDAGHLRLDPVPLADSVRRKEYRRLYSSLEYLWFSRRDTVYMRQLGIEKPQQLLDQIPAELSYYVRFGIDDAARTVEIDGSNSGCYYLPRGKAVPLESAPYRRVVFPEGGGWLQNDTISISARPDIEIRIASSDLLDRQLRQTGIASWGAMTKSDEHLMGLLDYRDPEGRYRILFSNIDLRGSDSLGWHVSFAAVEAVFLP